ncbi:MAG: ribosome-associated translation inhibitor RaiA [Neomegalonema sp.]|nr:ribosome-associated translation inhibitor RaiA [Neomegalonema sp.]
MRIEITGKQIDVGQALSSHVEEKLLEAIRKYAERPVEALVKFSKDAHLFVCDCSAHLSTGLTAQASAKENDVYAAADQAIARLEKQLRRYKRRLKDHHQQRKEPIASQMASSYVLADHDEDEIYAADSGSANGVWEPVIIAETQSAIPSLSVGEAVMQMELTSAAFLLFKNDKQGRLNAVYRREDGNVGWIDPSETPK